MSNILPFYKALRRHGFTRVHRNRTDQGCHIYEKQLGQMIVLEVQLWPDGNHRASYSIAGCSDSRPFNFTTVEHMLGAIGSETRAAELRVAGARWHPMELAPKGVFAESVTDPGWVEPPSILMLFPGGKQCVVHWDWYYAEGGAGFNKDCGAWVEPVSGELAHMHFGPPVGWMHLPPSG